MIPYIKEFDEWNKVKKRIHHEEREVTMRAGEVRWAIFGVNVGSELDGKGHSFTRPVLILHVVGKVLALVIPMSTKLKEVAGYHHFPFQGKGVSLCLHQIRVLSQKRILGRKGRISEGHLRGVKEEVRQFFSF